MQTYWRILLTSSVLGAVIGGYAATAGAGVSGDDFKGKLAKGDKTISGGYYVDPYGFNGKARDFVEVTLVAKGFHPILLVIPPNGDQFKVEGKTFDGKPMNKVEWNEMLDQGGKWRMAVTSGKVGATGDYDLHFLLSRPIITSSKNKTQQ